MSGEATHPKVSSLVEPNEDAESIFHLGDDDAYERALGVLAILTDRLMDTVKEMSDDDVRRPSLLPDWSRGHVLTHIARNADGACNLVEWAETGNETPMYASPEARKADIEAGAGRSASELESDVESSGERLLARIADLPVGRRHIEVRSSTGQMVPAHELLWWRMREVAYHHVDLDAGYRFEDLPDAVLLRGLDEAVERVAAAGAPSLRLAATDLDWTSGTEGAEVSGRASDLLAWLTGRSDGEGLRAEHALPQLPAWG
ncbi:MAG: maleylpyruvate isomerase family mycothiol-dependent enzyme [Actinomycetes bacterium]